MGKASGSSEERERCSICRFFQASLETPGAGACCRFPPIPMFDPDPKAHFKIASIFPGVVKAKDTWCGEFSRE